MGNHLNMFTNHCMCGIYLDNCLAKTNEKFSSEKGMKAETCRRSTEEINDRTDT